MTEPIAFRAEMRQLLHILVHSLYTDREIFLRELISNASDALNRVKFEMLTNRHVVDPEAEYAIRLTADKETRTLTLSDTGNGMNREELIENLGTIAHSGAASFLQALQEGKKADQIGQFGVGFYSVFMVADKVRVVSRSFRPEDSAWAWECTGADHYTLEPAEKTSRGTDIIITLKEDAAEFAETYRLEQIIRKHSDFIAFPIYVGDKVVNRQTPLWRQTASEVTDEAANAFYQQLTLEFEPPLARIQLNTDVPVHIAALLFVPAKAERGMFSLRKDPGLQLYSRSVLIQDYCKDLLPNFLRFVQGVVESDDVPLSVSRETVQSSKVMERIRNAVTFKVLDTLKTLAEKDPEKYAAFWREYRPFIKEGMATEPAHRDRLKPLLRFESSKQEGLTSLAHYVGRMPADQRAIYYLLADDAATAAHSPHLEYFRRHNLEVLFLTDPMDSFMLSGLPNYEGFDLKNVADPNLELPKAVTPAQPQETAPDDDFNALITRFKTVLGERVAEVRASDRLVDSPMRLVASEKTRDYEMERVRRLLEKDFKLAPRIVELNRAHPLIINLSKQVKDGSMTQLALAEACIAQMYDNALLLEGLHPNPADMVSRIQTLMEAAAGVARAS